MWSIAVRSVLSRASQFCISQFVLFNGTWSFINLYQILSLYWGWLSIGLGPLDRMMPWMIIGICNTAQPLPLIFKLKRWITSQTSHWHFKWTSNFDMPVLSISLYSAGVSAKAAGGVSPVSKITHVAAREICKDDDVNQKERTEGTQWKRWTALKTLWHWIHFLHLAVLMDGLWSFHSITFTVLGSSCIVNIYLLFHMCMTFIKKVVLLSQWSLCIFLYAHGLIVILDLENKTNFPAEKKKLSPRNTKGSQEKL